VLHAVDDLARSLSDLAAQVEHFLRAAVTVNLYATWGEVEGFNVHWDDHDVFVMQVAGSLCTCPFEAGQAVRVFVVFTMRA
jgi:ribosomal protein L16 Arg81 hydroxylase